MGLTTSVLLRGSDAIARQVRDVVAATRDCLFDQVDSVGEAISLVQRGGVGLVLIAIDGTDDEQLVDRFLRSMGHYNLSAPTLVLLDKPDPRQTLRLMRQGVVECLPQPLDTARLAMLTDLLTVRARHQQGAVAVHSAAAPPSDVAGCLIVSPAMRQLMNQIRLAAPLDSTILLTGETGTGKTCLARGIHMLSPRASRPFLVINCGALSPTLIESEMFGHARGAFTGADKDHIGKLEASQDGTLLLDEIDSLPLTLQGKLLRAVEERVFEPVGSNQTAPMRARLIVATNRGLEDEVAAGRFRADLYYRLNVLDFHVPPLRERREAIPHLVNHLLAELSLKLHRRMDGFSAQAMQAFTVYDWPGNVRELRNVVERAVALSISPTIELCDLPVAIRGAFQRQERVGMSVTKENRLAAARQVAENERLSAALARHNNNRSHAAAELGISRVTLYKKLRKHGMT